MTLLPVPGCLRVAYSGTFQGGNWANVHHLMAYLTPPSILDKSPWTQEQVDFLAEVLPQEWAQCFGALAVTVCQLTKTTVQDLSSNTGAYAESSETHAGVLTQTGVLPANAAVCIGWAENYHFRGGHLRTYLTPPAQFHIADLRHWTTAFIGACTTQSQLFLSDLAGMTQHRPQGIAKVGVHRWRNHLELNPPLVYPVRGARCDARIDTQRRRLGRDPA